MAVVMQETADVDSGILYVLYVGRFDMEKASIGLGAGLERRSRKSLQGWSPWVVLFGVPHM